MSVTVQIPTPMRDLAGGRSEVPVEGASVQAALAALVAACPGLEAKLFDKGQLRHYVNVYVNDEDIRFLDDLDTPIKDTDTIALIPAVAGG